jgi:hypothetical protein
MTTPPRPLRAISDEATSEFQMLAGRDSRSQEFLRVLRISREFVRGFRGLHHIGPCITFFGSSRFDESHPYYEPSRASPGGWPRWVSISSPVAGPA